MPVFHAGGGGVKKRQNSVHVVVECLGHSQDVLNIIFR
jgi:hypothetical protein